MSDGHKLAQLIREASKPPQNHIVDLVVGKVTSIKPLKVKVENKELTESFLIVGAMCQETHIYTPNIKKLDHYHVIPSTSTQSAGETSHSHSVSSYNTQSDPKSPNYDILLWRGLKVGDCVIMLKVAQGQKYFILQRQEGVIDNDS